MNIEQHLKETKARLQQTVDRTNSLEREKQQLLQEMLRIDGQIKLLEELKKEGLRPAIKE